ncbi:MDR/zinc-dependent alcohol dehydrogenase-like family protein [Spirulina subsalsa]|uniref:MDR/zinc-dependent alcohol dehydrogenase-like family protein n=1 Tax=Spirulina subsalsa TaxID=54311 RepID=UPI0002F449C1
MQGIWLENQTLELKSNLPLPEPSRDEALVRVLRAGICNTDLELLRGYYPYRGVLGHEFVGIVEQGLGHLKHKRVVGEINASCGECLYCQKGKPTHCEKRTVLGIVNRNGAFAEYLTLPNKNLYPLPDHISTDAATFIEPLAAALEIQEQIPIHPGQKVLVIGDGKLGQLIGQTLALTGCDLSVVGRHRSKLANLEKQGIHTGFADIVQERSFDIAVECTGNPSGFELALKGLRPRGTLVLKSTYAGNLSINASALVVDEITLIGSRCGPFAKAIDLLDKAAIDPTPLIQTCYPLSEGLAAFDAAQQKGALKVLLTME